MKKIIIYLCFLLPWFIGGILFKYNPTFYEQLNIPFFALPGYIISICWFILYILIAFSIYKVYKQGNIIKNRDYLYVLLTNYLANMTFGLFFFTLQSPFLGFIDTIIVLISSIYLYLETKNINKKASYYILPYIIYCIYASVLSLTIFIMNF